jgi:DNA-packaging protein gp3
MCAAPKGNQFWKLRSKHGRDKLFATPELLWEAACEYFAYCDKNPWKVVKDKTKGKNKEKEESPTQCPYTLTGLMAYLDVSKSFWNDFKKGGHEDFSVVITRIENIIESQQLEGAIVGAFNANIVSRINGLADKQEIDHTNAGKEFKGFNFLPYTPEVEKEK